MNHSETGSEVTIASHYIRSRNTLCLRGVFTPLFVDYYLHLMENKMRYEESYDSMLKDGLVAIALHSASRPRDEVIAWTMNFTEPHLNLFVTGNNRTGTVTGRLFTKNVRKSDQSLFFSQVIRGNDPAQQSMTPIAGSDLFKAVEMYYEQSQQLPARYFEMSDPEEVAMLVGMPDCDTDWLRTVTAEEVEHLDRHETVSLLETRHFSFGCECDVLKVIRALASLSTITRTELFAEEDVLHITCPRCGARYEATQEDIEKSLEL